MFEPDTPLHYFSVGRSALACIDTCLATAGKSDIQQILDFGCGHGRVLRVLRRRFPDAHITASDIDRAGVDFCARTFGARGVHSDINVAPVVFDDRFDLVWVGSVFTHLARASWAALLPVLGSSLAPDGVLVFTTDGPDVEWRVRCGYGLQQATVTSIFADYGASGFGYAAYPNMSGYGISLSEPQAVQRLSEKAGLRMVDYLPMGWDNNQDVFACVPASSGTPGLSKPFTAAGVREQ
jgi:SAM-dependent methyltransferase